MWVERCGTSGECGRIGGTRKDEPSPGYGSVGRLSERPRD